jgi:hypothetical protein
LLAPGPDDEPEADPDAEPLGPLAPSPPTGPQLFALYAASVGVRPLQASGMAGLPLVAATLPLAAVEFAELGMAGFGFAGSVGFVVSSEALGAVWVLAVSAVVVFFVLFMSPKARAVPLERAMIEVRMNAGASLRICAS